MTKFFFLLAWRNIKNNWLNSIITIAGLSIGICAFIIISLALQFELSYEKFNENYKQLYVLEQKITSPNQGISYKRFSPSPLPEKLKNDFPEVRDYARFLRTSEKFQLEGSSKIIADWGLYADPSFCSLFKLKFLAGTPEKALLEPNKIILTRSLKEKLFGDIDPEECIGKTVLVSENQLYEITAITEIHPRNTEIYYSYILSMPTMDETDEDWGSETFNIIMLEKGANYKALNEKISNYLQNINKSFENKQVFLLPIEDNHLNNPVDTKKKMIVYVALLLTVFILLISFINFINLRYANGITRIKETSLKKVLGARRSKIVFQWIGESALITFISFDIALILAELFLPSFNSQFGFKFKLISFENWQLIFVVFCITLFIGIISGSIPALRISSIKITNSLKNQFKSSKSKFGAKTVLLVFQISLTVIFISSMMIMRMQVNYQINKDKGFNEKNVLVYPFYASSVNRNRIEKMQKLALELQINSSIEDVSISCSAPFIDYYNYNNFYSEIAGASSSVQMKYNVIDLNYISTLDIDLTEGRMFIPEDMYNSVCIINETAQRKLGLENAVGSIIQPMNLEVIGVLKDYHTGDMNWPIFPLIMTPRIDTVSYTKNVLIIRLAKENTEEVRTWINTKTKEFFPDDRIEYEWLESYIPYSITKTISKIFEIFSVIAICISIIGLFGMVTYSTVARSKEIGIRKVMGASSRTIFNLLLKSHLKLVIIANVISWPLAYYIMKMFLQIFAYRINISIFVFVATGLITFLIMFLTVGYHILKASRTNPIKELRYE